MFTWVCSSLSSQLAQVNHLQLQFYISLTFSVWTLAMVMSEHTDLLLSGRRLNISAENDCRRLHCSLRDLSSLLQAVGRLAEHFIGEVFAARFSDAVAVVERSVTQHR